MSDFSSKGVGLGKFGSRPIVFLMVVFLVMVGCLIYLDGGERERGIVPTIENPTEPISVDLDATRIPWDPKTETWGPIHDTDDDRRLEIPRTALERAMTRVSERPWSRFKLGGGFERIEPGKFLANPNRHRGEPVEGLGELLALKSVDLVDKYGFRLPELLRTYEGILRLRESLHGSSVAVRFLLVDKFRGEGDPTDLVGSQVKIQGVFFKIHTDGIGDATEPETTIWILAKRLYRNYKVPEAGDVDLTLLRGVKDAKVRGDETQEFFSNPLFHLLSHVLNAKPEDLSGDTVNMKGKQVSALLEKPEEFRGKTIRFQGRVIRREHHPMEAFFEQNDQGDNPISDIWMTYITPDGNVPVPVLWVVEPQEDIAFEDQVVVNGIFYRLWGYKASPDPEKPMQDRYIRAPLLVGVGAIEVLDVGGPGAFGWLGMAVLGFALAAIMLVVMVVRTDRRNSKLFRDTRAARRQVTRGALDLNAIAGGAGGSEESADDKTSDGHDG